MASKEAPELATQPQDEGDEKFLTPEGVLDKPSPRTDSLQESDNHDHTETENNDEKSDPGDEIVYPSLITKISVGIGLALAVLLVYPPSFEILMRSGIFGSNHCRYGYTQDFRPFQGVESSRLVRLRLLSHDVQTLYLPLVIFRTALQPMFGKLYKVFNVKYVFLVAVAIFESRLPYWTLLTCI
jgi:hypothetical protein